MSIIDNNIRRLMAAQYITVEEIVTDLEAQGVHTSKRTVDRQLAWLKANDKENYNRIVTREDKKLLYKRALILPYLTEFKQNKKITSKPTVKADKAQKVTDTGGTAKERTAGTKPGKIAAPNVKGNYRKPEDTEQKLTELLDLPQLLYEPDPVTRDTLNNLKGPEKERYEYAISICAEYALGLNNLEYCCIKYNIPPQTFWTWRNRISEIGSLFKNARRKRKRAMSELLADAAEAGLLQLVKGTEYVERAVTYEKHMNPDGTYFSIEKDVRETNKLILPSVPAVIFTATNRAPHRWKNRQFFGKDDTPPAKPADKLSQLSEGELLQLVIQNMGITPEQLQKMAEGLGNDS